ncbi:MAG: YfhO family protein [Candidatus Promineofilum sp.]|nr:YfhO family protein [Promineifilum sp.]MBP9656572.1 YfhO family protein [Promineifilum sp.]
MTSRGRARYGVWAPLLLIALILLFFNKMAFSNLILARGDTFLYFYPYWQAAADALRAGRIPLWNPDIFMGAPFLANSQVGFFYPLNWPVWLLLRTPYAAGASILIHLAIAGGGTYWAAQRTLGLGRIAALVAAALFALGGYLTAQVEHINQLQGLAWLPWLFVALSPLVAPAGVSRSWRSTVAAALAVGALFALQLLAGHTQTVFISGVAVALWLAVWVTQELPSMRAGRSRRLIGLGAVLPIAVGLAAMLAAIQLLPTLELTGLSSRQGGLPLNEVLSFSWNPLHLTRALLPGYGSPLFTEYVAFLPLTGLALAVVGAWSWRRNPEVRPWLALVVFGLILALGRFTPIYYLLGRLPGFDLFRAPARWLAPATLGVALLAGYGWQRLRWYVDSDRSNGDSVARQELIRPLIVAGVGFGLLVVWGYAAGWLAAVVPVGAEAPFERPATIALLGWAIEFVLAALFLSVILNGPLARARSATVELLLLGAAVLWLGSRGLPYNQLTTPEAWFDLRPPQARLIALGTCVIPDEPCPTPSDRFLSLSEIFFDPGDTAEIKSIYADQLPEEAIYDYIVAVKNKEVLSPNLSMITHAPAIDGFDGGILPMRAYSRLMSLILPAGSATTDGRLREYLTAAPDAKWLSLFNGRFLITDKTGDIWREGVFFDRQHPVTLGDEPVAVAEVPPFEATELWMLAGVMPPPVEVTTIDGDVQQLSSEWLVASAEVEQADPPLHLYRLPFAQPATAAAIVLQPCADPAVDCAVSALTLVDARDDTYQPLTFAPYRLIHSGDVKIYENLDAQPRAFIVHDWRWTGGAQAAGVDEAVALMADPDFDPRASAVIAGSPAGPEPSGDGLGIVEIIHYSPEAIRLLAESDRDVLLVLTDAYYPGWEATIDGRPATIERVDGLFRGVFVPPGVHEVEFYYRPASLRTGMAITALGLLVMSAAAISLYVMSRRRPFIGESADEAVSNSH